MNYHADNVFKAELKISWEYCMGQEVPLNVGTIIGIAIFLVGLAIPASCITYAMCCYDSRKSKHNRAAGEHRKNEDDFTVRLNAMEAKKV